MSTKQSKQQIAELKALADQLSDEAFLDAAEACGVYLVGDQPTPPEQQSFLLLEAMQGLSQSEIAQVAQDAEVVPAHAVTFFADKEPKFDGPAVNCEKPVELELSGIWIDQSKKGWANKWLQSAIMLRNTLVGLAKAECAIGKCPGEKACSFVVDGGIKFGRETDSQGRTMRIRAVVSLKGKCVCPTRPATGNGDGGDGE